MFPNHHRDDLDFPVGLRKPRLTCNIEQSGHMNAFRDFGDCRRVNVLLGRVSMCSTFAPTAHS